MTKQIKPEELRPGNIVKSDPISIPKLGIWSDGYIRVTAYGIWMLSEGHILKWEPVPLTEEILVKAGFEKFEDKFHSCWEKTHGFNHYHFFIRPELQNQNCGCMGIYHPKCEAYAPTKDDPERFIELEPALANFTWNIRHVHQLMNLWFSLTGEELIINL